MNAFKPGTAEQVRRLLAIADAAPHHTIAAHLEGGRAGGHHSWEDLEELLLETYHELRRRENVLRLRGRRDRHAGARRRPAVRRLGARARRAADAGRCRARRHGGDGVPGSRRLAAVKRALVAAGGAQGWVPRRGVEGGVTSRALEPERRHPPARQRRLARRAPARDGRGRRGGRRRTARRDRRRARADGEAVHRRRRVDDLPGAARALHRALRHRPLRPLRRRRVGPSELARPRGRPVPPLRRPPRRRRVGPDQRRRRRSTTRPRRCARSRRGTRPRRRRCCTRPTRSSSSRSATGRANRCRSCRCWTPRSAAGTWPTASGRPRTTGWTPTRSSSSPGPEAVAGITRADEPVAELLARFEAAAIARADGPPVARARLAAPGPAPAPLHALTGGPGPIAALCAAQCVVPLGRPRRVPTRSGAWSRRGTRSPSTTERSSSARPRPRSRASRSRPTATTPRSRSTPPPPSRSCCASGRCPAASTPSPRSPATRRARRSPPRPWAPSARPTIRCAASSPRGAARPSCRTRTARPRERRTPASRSISRSRWRGPR